MFCLQAPDLFLGDVAVVNTIKELLDIHEKEAMEICIQKNGVRIARWLLFFVALLPQKKEIGQ
jgi:DNA-3-methyladenine glycosylase II